MSSSLKICFCGEKRSQNNTDIRASLVGKCLCSSGMFDCRRSTKKQRDRVTDRQGDGRQSGKQKCRFLSSACWVKRILQREAFRFEPASQLDSQSDLAEDDEELSIE